MARYIKDVTLNQPEDFVQFIMNDYLQKNGFIMSDWKGEPAYRAGDALIEGFKFLKWSYSNGVFHLEAWLKGTFGGEWDLNGFVAILQKKPYRENLEKLIAALQQSIPQPDISLSANGQNVVPVHTVDNSKAATQALILGIAALLFSWSPLICIIISCIGFARARMGAGSSKGGQAKAGKVCCIVAICITLALYIFSLVINFLAIMTSAV